jgi:hypothetical protein
MTGIFSSISKSSQAITDSIPEARALFINCDYVRKSLFKISFPIKKRKQPFQGIVK